MRDGREGVGVARRKRVDHLAKAQLRTGPVQREQQAQRAKTQRAKTKRAKRAKRE